MPQPQSNESRLRRRLTRKLQSVFGPSARAEIIDAIVLHCAARILDTPALHSEFADLFCPYCGGLHPLPDCTAPDVVAYRLNPQAWMDERLPSSVRIQLHEARVAVRGREAKPSKLGPVPCSAKPSKLPSRPSGAESTDPVCRCPAQSNIPSALHKLWCPLYSGIAKSRSDSDRNEPQTE